MVEDTVPLGVTVEDAVTELVAVAVEDKVNVGEPELVKVGVRVPVAVLDPV